MKLRQCAIGVAWTSGLTALAITFLLFTFFDPADAVEMFNLNVDPGTFRMQAYAILIATVWLVLGASVAMNCFYNSLRNSSCGDCGPADTDSTPTDDKK
ncbi:MAG: hypothetical protein HOM84_07365 [Thiotrichales bacterium]|jgi:hypothetical protein|nr:hypothetical protein [Thiotrichales bacterium]MBT3613784.1 hypothetical protein [Thiotrichales bacterium]MBT3753224.1 hypothetical protein [Thiotrichales bacterium]MBT3837871.1 hypothetical protein [Thiotrichales bacterium]MBT4152076.1 hypothetical protein [Thiotrichales bacterium]